MLAQLFWKTSALKIVDVGSETFGNPFIEKILQNQPSSFNIGVPKEGHVRFCKRRGADGFFSIPHWLQFATFTFHFFLVNTLLGQGRAALHCSKIERQISHENECFDIFFFHFCDFFIIDTFFINNQGQRYRKFIPNLHFSYNRIEEGTLRASLLMQ